MQSVAIPCRGQAAARLFQAAACLLLLFAIAAPVPAAAALSLFGGKQVEVTLTGRDGQPMADAEVRVFAPGAPNQPVVTGHTDRSGKFVFEADHDGLWTAEARRNDEVARVTIRVSDADAPSERISPYVLLGGLVLLLGLAIWFRMLRAKNRRPRV